MKNLNSPVTNDFTTNINYYAIHGFWSITQGDYLSKAEEYAGGNVFQKKSRYITDIYLTTACLSAGIVFMSIIFYFLVKI